MFLSLTNGLIKYPLLAPADSEGGELSKDEIIANLIEDSDIDDKDDEEIIDTKDKPEDKPEVIEEDKGDEDDEEEVDELTELEDELEGPTDEQLELVTPVRRKEILSKYPKLFADFPYLEKAYYREQQYTELLPTIDDAKTAVENTRILKEFETDLLGGSIEKVLKGVKGEDPKAFAQIADNYLKTLHAVDAKAYHTVLGNVIKHTVYNMLSEAQAKGDESLQEIAEGLNNYIFGTKQFSKPTKLADEIKDDKNDPKAKALAEREKALDDKQFERANVELQDRVKNVIKNTIDAHIDPKNSMTDYVKRNATRDALDKVGELIGKDSRFKVLVGKLWDRAKASNYSKESVDSVRSAYVSRAKTLLPTVIKQARNEALKDGRKRIKDTDDDSNKGPVKPGRSATPSKQTSKIKSAKDIPAGMTDMQFLMSD